MTAGVLKPSTCQLFVNRSNKLTQSANGEACTIRGPLGCAPRETVVWCHGWMNKGMGIKTDDIEGCFGCVTCHDWIDRRLRWQGELISDEDRLFYFHRAMVRSLLRLLERGVLKI